MNRQRIAVCSVSGLGICLFFTLVFSSRLLAGEQKQNMDSFARCLAEKKTTMYGSFLCPHCDDQKKIFGDSFKYVPYVECLDSNTRKTTAVCVAAQIHYTPTWTFASGERLTGVQSAEQLSHASGCPLP